MDKPLRQHPSAVRCHERRCGRTVTVWDEFMDAGTRTIFTMYACAEHGVDVSEKIKRWKPLPVVSTAESQNPMNDTTNHPIQIGDAVESNPYPGSQTPSGEGTVTRLDPDNFLVFVRFDGEAEDFGCLPVELLVTVTA